MVNLSRFLVVLRVVTTIFQSPHVRHFFFFFYVYLFGCVLRRTMRTHQGTTTETSKGVPPPHPLPAEVVRVLTLWVRVVLSRPPGSNDGGQLGYEDSITRGTGTGEGLMGNALPVVDLGRDQKAITVAAGFFHTCAMLYTGVVKCWGEFRSSFGWLCTVICAVIAPGFYRSPPHPPPSTFSAWKHDRAVVAPGCHAFFRETKRSPYPSPGL